MKIEFNIKIKDLNSYQLCRLRDTARLLHEYTTDDFSLVQLGWEILKELQRKEVTADGS